MRKIGRFADEINTHLNNIPFESNILEEYDNVTYNYCFYMIPYNNYKTLQEKLSELKGNEKDVTDIVREYTKERVVIAQSGVSTDYAINNISLKTYPTPNNTGFTTATAEITFKLEEYMNCNLNNKIFFISKLLGYEAYFLQPYFFDIWFSGYESAKKNNRNNTTAVEGKAVRQIGGLLYTFNCMVASCKSKINSNSTTYDFKLTPTFMEGLMKNNNVNPSFGNINFKDLIGEKIQKNNGFKTLCNKIEKYITDIKTNIPENKKKKPDDNKTTKNKNDKIQEEALIWKQLLNNKTIIEIKCEQADKITIKDTINSFHPDEEMTLDRLFEELLSVVDKIEGNDPTGYMVRTKFTPVPIGEVNGKIYNRMVIDLKYIQNTDIKHIVQMGSDSFGKTRKELAKENQISRLAELKKQKLLCKEYSYMSGTDLDVINENIKIENLWYLNVFSYFESEKTNTQLPNQNIELVDLPKAYDKLKKQIGNNIDRYSISDLYELLCRNGASLKNELLKTSNGYAISKKYVTPQNSITGSVGMVPDDTSGNSDEIIESRKPVYGYDNLFNSGNAITITIDIIGDPYWLGASSLNGIYNTSEESKYNSTVTNVNNKTEEDKHTELLSLDMPFIYYQRRSMTSPTPDDTYKYDDDVEISNLYQITQIVSKFEDGKFTQTLTGVVNPLFLEITKDS